ncbi:sigma-70 family RNA polymerase sigma factor [Derxia lacustris]|uniref:sigma-70 family RNA polymerase sigma factor n=1 Tax=Derxia lacustris TaxID=764842 RepID=UPI001F157664|nr:sigma-70 family RNA polymerase sigma factor [Derxia lacustris]
METTACPGPLAQTFIAHRGRLKDAAQKIVRTPEIAEDILQEAYLKVTGFAADVAVQHPVGYCFQIVRNLAIDHRRRGKLELDLFTESEKGEQVPAACTSPEQIAIDRQNLRIVCAVIADLPPRTRQAFELHRLQSMTQRDIAERLGISATLVNFMIKDAMAALQNCRHLLARD